MVEAVRLPNGRAEAAIRDAGLAIKKLHAAANVLDDLAEANHEVEPSHLYLIADAIYEQVRDLRRALYEETGIEEPKHY